MAAADYLPVLSDALLLQQKYTDLLGQIQPGNRPAALESQVRLAIGQAQLSIVLLLIYDEFRHKEKRLGKVTS